MNNSARFLLPLLTPASGLFEGVVRLRDVLYSKGVIRAQTLSRPVISVGNITTGGTGKTPLAIHIAMMVSEFGKQPALLSRGYGRKQKGMTRIVAPEAEIAAEAACLGDEPALIRRRVPRIWLGLSADRYDAGCAILRRQPDVVFILDDGFQHRKLNRTMDIVVLDSSQPLESNHLLPRGSLREPLPALRRAQVIIVNGDPDSASCDALCALARRIHPAASVLRLRQEIQSLVPFAEWRAGTCGDSARMPVRRAFLAAAIGNPGRFRRDVEALGIEIAGASFYRDHAVVGRVEWRYCAEEARRRGAEVMIVTEKDAIKISDPPPIPIRVAIQSTRIVEEKEFGAILERVIGETR